MRLSCSGVGFGYSTSSEVLCKVDFNVDQGESVAIMGPSGSGKTTLLSILGGLLEPTEGTVGVTIAELERAVLPSDIAWIFQTSNVLKNRSTLDNVVLGGLSAGLSRRQSEQEAQSILRSLGMGGHSAQVCGTLSGGEIQRVVVARALASRSPFVLADEPTGQLDHANTSRTMELLRMTSAQVGEHGLVGLVVSTHDMAVAEICDRIVILSGKSLSPA